MQETPLATAPTPPDCFRQQELETFQAFENQTLGTVHYYLWPANPEPAFLYALELYFENGETLLLSSGESTEAIRLISAESLVETARKLQEIHGQALLQRMVANVQPLWQGAIGQELAAIQLSRHESGLYRNDALLLDFGAKQIFLQLSEKDGLELGLY